MIFLMTVLEWLVFEIRVFDYYNDCNSFVLLSFCIHFCLFTGITSGCKSNKGIIVCVCVYVNRRRRQLTSNMCMCAHVWFLYNISIYCEFLCELFLEIKVHKTALSDHGFELNHKSSVGLPPTANINIKVISPS